jgi:hypothetical protein
MGRQTLRSFHDEPFVIDNFPLDIDLGDHHQRKTVKGAGKTWIRQETILNSILVLEKSLGGTKDFRIDRLNLDKPINVLLENSKELSLTFNEDGPASSLTISPSVDLTKTGRRMKQKEGEARIVLIRWFPKDGADAEEHRPVLQPLSSIYVVLFNAAEAHTSKNAGSRKRKRKQTRR